MDGHGRTRGVCGVVRVWLNKLSADAQDFVAFLLGCSFSFEEALLQVCVSALCKLSSSLTCTHKHTHAHALASFPRIPTPHSHAWVVVFRVVCRVACPCGTLKKM